jgi:hypothetical protein
LKFKKLYNILEYRNTYRYQLIKHEKD